MSAACGRTAEPELPLLCFQTGEMCTPLHRAMHKWIAFRRGGLGGRSWLLWLYALLTLNGGIKPTITVYINYICMWRKLIASSCVKVSWWKSNLAHASQGLGDFHAFKAPQTESKIYALWNQVLLKPLFCSAENFPLFCAPSDHRTAQVGRELERSSGPPFDGKGSLGGLNSTWSNHTLQLSSDGVSALSLGRLFHWGGNGMSWCWLENYGGASKPGL